ncbi:unnamed protein product [Rotaria sordida]|uniref:Cobalamin-independent methionine synthase MetE C-terminal/archaeal domain-containing protein n=1 Tax=Rotaria sordida TaxID=392033 RepID=A0A814QKD0_9BILA|nr:unnamed protein product [Rotaria sordida]CAF3876556.1 unnamed protein product [Rotaria sordida]
MARSQKNWIIIPTELIGSLPRAAELVEAQRAHKYRELSTNRLTFLQEKDIRHVLRDLARTGSLQLTDGELTKPSFLNYPIYDLAQYNYSFDGKNITTITYADGHRRCLPQLIKSPFRYSTFAVKYLRAAQKYTLRPLKQAVVAPSVLSLVYNGETIKNYSREQFLNDLIDEAEKDVRQCLEAGADKVQLDFAKARLSLKMDPSGNLLKEFIDINNRMLDRFNEEERKKLGVHVCSGNDRGSTHSADVDCSRILNELFQLKLNNFYLQMTTELDPDSILSLIGKLIKPHHRVFIGVINPRDLHVETSEIVRDRVLTAAKYIPIEQLGTTDDCGFSPYNDNELITREKCYEKIRARVEGTKLAEEILNLSMQKIRWI